MAGAGPDGPAPIAERMLAFRRPRDLTAARDGRLACSVGPVARLSGTPLGSRIWAGSADAGPLAPLTDEEGEDALPRWSADGSSLIFASDRGTPGLRSGLFAIDPRGGTPREVARLAGGIEALEWESERSLLAVVGDAGVDSLSLEGATRTAVQGDPHVVRPEPAWRRLVRIDVETGVAHEVGPPGWTIWEVSAGADGTVAALGSEEASENGWYRSAILLLDLGARTARVLHRGEWQLASPAVSPDGGEVAFVEGWTSDRGLAIGDVRVVDVRSGAVREVAVADADASWLRWRDAGTLWFAGVAGLRSAYGLLDAHGGEHRVWTEDATMRDRFQGEITPCGDGIAAVIDRFEQPWEVAWRPLDDDRWRLATELNADWSAAPPSWQLRPLSWEAHDGLTIEGLLVRRREDLGAGPLPLIVTPRPGPSFPLRFGSLFLHLALAVEAGYPVLLVNPRGTPGRGQAFSRGNIPAPGADEISDTLAGVDALAAEGVADPDRVAIAGGSWAGYLAAWAATTRSDRFRCAVVLYALTNLVSWHRTTNMPRCIEGLVQGRPEGEAGVARYMRLSPVTYAHESTTPTLILTGDQDLCTPAGQAHELYQALAEAGAEVEMATYPREGHSTSTWEREHQMDYAARTLGWIERHLGAPAPS